MAIVDFDPKRHFRGCWRWFNTALPYNRQHEDATNEICRRLSEESEAAMRMTDDELASSVHWGGDYQNELHVRYLETERRRALDVDEPTPTWRADGTGVERITAERERQITKEGWTAEHDDWHRHGGLALAAVCYAAPIRVYKQEMCAAGFFVVDPWPWDKRWDKRPHNGNVLAVQTDEERIRCLEKAGALIAAEIDRLLRKKEREK